jgi:acyl-CoA thioester hydrolase
MTSPFVHRVQIYYEDTDLSGVVYHANYLKYFERAREHMIGPAELVRLYEQDGVGFVVYRAELTYKEGAKLGDTIEVRTTVVLESRYRAIFHHDVWRPSGAAPMVQGVVHLVCVDRSQKLVPLPEHIYDALKA